MKRALFLLVFTSTLAHAALEKSPTDLYDMTHLMTKKTLVTVVPVPNVIEACERESRKRGFGGFGSAMEACSFWSGSVCTIYVPLRSNNDQLGHELHHCFSGSFH